MTRYRKTIVYLFLGLCAGTTQAAIHNVSPGADLPSLMQGAADGDVIRLAAGTYTHVGYIKTTRNITLIGAPFEDSDQDETKIGDVIVSFDPAVSDNWEILGQTTVRGIKFVDGDHHLVADNKVLIEHCIFVGGVDQLSFNSDGYGDVAYCQFYQSGDDGIDMDSKATAAGAYFNIHHNHFEDNDEDGVEFRTFRRRAGAEMMEVEFHHNTFVGCGTGGIGDAIQIIDQVKDGTHSRNILIYNNVFDGQNATHNGLGCNAKNSKAQKKTTGGTLADPIWVWNNTFTRYKSAGVAGGTSTWAVNNIVTDSPRGYVRCEVVNNLTYGVAKNLGAAAIDGGGNFFNQDPEMDANTLVLQPGSFCIDKGLPTFTAGGRTLTPAFIGIAPDLGGLERDGVQTNFPPVFSGNLLSKPRVIIDMAYTNSIANEAFDSDHDPLTFTIERGPVWLTMSPGGALFGTPHRADIGDNSWTVQVLDKEGSDTATLEIEVWDGLILSLVADAGSDQTLLAGDDGAASALLSAVDSTGDIVAYLWTENGMTLKTGPINEQDFSVGVHTVILTLTDSQGGTDTDELMIIVENDSTISK